MTPVNPAESSIARLPEARPADLTTAPYLAVDPDTLVLKAMALIQQQRAGYVLVMLQERLVGIFTDRDAVQAIAMRTPLEERPIAAFMSTVVHTLPEAEADDIFPVLRQFEEQNLRPLPVLDSQGQVVRVMTPQAVQAKVMPSALLQVRTVAEIMTPVVFYGTTATSLQQLAQMLIAHHLSCVVIVEKSLNGSGNQTPLGIVTERDILQGYALSQSSAQSLIRGPLLTVSPTESLAVAFQILQRHPVQQMVVTGEQGELLGLISQTGILRSLDPLALYGTIRSLQQALDAKTAALQTEICQRQAAETQLQSARTHLVSNHQELERLAYLDGLTEIANRRHFDQTLAQEWQRLRREKLPLTMIVCDLDRFQQFNQRYGHDKGDACLRQVAYAIADTVNRVSDIVARYGGEEFAVLLPHTDLAGAVQLVERIQLAILALQIPAADRALSDCMTVSFGIASCVPSFSVAFADLMTAADRALYKAKENGRNGFCIAVENDAQSKPRFRLLE
jgi:diguanylate cyclase (GGDEF)-like protein